MKKIFNTILRKSAVGQADTKYMKDKKVKVSLSVPLCLCALVVK